MNVNRPNRADDPLEEHPSPDAIDGLDVDEAFVEAIADAGGAAAASDVKAADSRNADNAAGSNRAGLREAIDAGGAAAAGGAKAAGFRDALDAVGVIDGGGKAAETALPRVGERYKAFIIAPVAEPTDDIDQKFIAGADCGIGSEVRIVFPGEDEGKSEGNRGAVARSVPAGGISIESRSGRPIGRVTGAVADKIIEYQTRGWDVTAHLTLITLDRERREFSTEVVVFCLSPEDDAIHEALQKFKRGLLRRIKRGENPKPQLTQKDFERVVRTGGEWCYTAIAKEPELRDDEAFFKRRQSLADRVADLGMDHRIGCSIASIVIIAAIVLLILKLIGLF